jgi:hypothetical protein
MQPAIEAVRAEVGADVAICRVSTVGPMITVTALDGSTLRTFQYESRVLAESDQTSRYRDTCAAADDVLAVDVGMFHVFLIDHPATVEFVISGMDGEPSYHAWVPSSNGEHRVRFNLDSQTGETVSTFP